LGELISRATKLAVHVGDRKSENHKNQVGFAKRLIDYGFHAPTVSFPVAETLMIEPTESENKEEIDRFCNALISIRQEIKDIENEKADRDNNLLINAPHTHHLLLDNWQHSYSKEQAFFPDSSLHYDKYWPPVGRIDNVQGDRHLICSCPDTSSYDDARYDPKD